MNYDAINAVQIAAKNLKEIAKVPSAASLMNRLGYINDTMYDKILDDVESQSSIVLSSLHQTLSNR